MKISACYKIAYILKPHGLKGEVTFSLDPEFPASAAEPGTVFLEKDNSLVPYFIERISVRGDRAFVKFEDVDDPEEALAVSKRAVYLAKKERPKLAHGDFYDDEVIGFNVNDQQAGVIGKVTGVTVAGPNRLLALQHEGKEVLIPVNGPFITGINKAKKMITVDLPEGFLDI